MTSTEEKIEKIKAEFALLKEWDDRYALIIEKGRKLNELKDEEKEEKFLIKGCQSRLWIKASLEDGKIYFRASSDAIITKGIVALLLEVFSGENPKNVLNQELSFLDDIGLKDHLSPTRSNGLNAMIKQIKLYALAFSLQK